LLYNNLKIKIYRAIILSVVLYGCETWLLALREERVLRVLRIIFGPKRDELTGDWRTLYNEKLNDLYCSPNIFQVIKLRRMRWAGHVVCMGEERGMYRVLIGYLRERDHLGDPGIDARIILRWIFRKWDVGVWTGLI
jgi:hypothetical protein